MSLREIEAAEAETARKLAADRAVELESPALRTYVSQNPDADMTLLKFMDEMTGALCPGAIQTYEVNLL